MPLPLDRAIGLLSEWEELTRHKDASPEFDEALRHLLDLATVEPYVPDRNCSCLISPPCHDCVENSGPRYIQEAIRDFLKEHTNAPKT